MLDQLAAVYPNLPGWLLHGTDQQIANCLTTYHPLLFHLVISPLIRRCPNLQVILCGDEIAIGGPADTWRVQLDHRRAEEYSPHAGGTKAEPCGHIEVIRTLQLSTLSEPADAISIPFPIPPSTHFSLRCRGDAKFQPLQGTIMDPSMIARWDKALRGSTFCAKLHRLIDTADIPFTLPLFTGIYDQQRQAGVADTDRVSLLNGRRLSWDMGEFTTFAQAASISLSTLVLTDQWDSSKRESDLKVSFSDVPSLVSIITASLPNLLGLSLALSGIATAEAAFGNLLHDKSLEDGGRITFLNIVTPPIPTPLFNIIRYFSQICSSAGMIAINTLGDVWWGPEAQTEIFRYMRRQPQVRQAHLATIDFISLGIIHPQHISELSYGVDGRPKRPIEGRMAGWADSVRADGDAVTAVQIPNLLQRLAKCTETMDRVAARAAGVDDEGLLSDAQEALSAVELVRAAAEEIVGMSVAQVDEMRRYVIDLKTGLGHS